MDEGERAGPPAAACSARRAGLQSKYLARRDISPLNSACGLPHVRMAKKHCTRSMPCRVVLIRTQNLSVRMRFSSAKMNWR